MGTDGMGPYDNDDAMDFLADFESEPTIARIAQALRASTIAPDDYLESPAASVAVAAAELVASAAEAARSGQTALGPATQSFLDALSTADRTKLSVLARAALSRIATDSELKELWAAASDDCEPTVWKQSLMDISNRLA